MILHDTTSRWLLSYLTGRVQNYQRRVMNDIGRLREDLVPGDVGLVEGHTRISQIIMYLTQSSWSHASLYVGDALLRWGGPVSDRALDEFGDDALNLLIESDLKRGVVAVPLSRYRDQNIRVCRPMGLTQGQIDQVMTEVIKHLGVRYDRQNIFDLARYLLPFHLLPRGLRRRPLYLGASTSREVICSDLIARAFYRVGLSIQPPLAPASEGGRDHPWVMRHPSYIMPRDFDLSEAFEVVKVRAFQPL